MKHPRWLRRLAAEVEGRTEAREKSLHVKGLHAWVRIETNRAGTKKIIHYAIYKDGRRIKGLKLNLPSMAKEATRQGLVRHSRSLLY